MLVFLLIAVVIISLSHYCYYCWNFIVPSVSQLSTTYPHAHDRLRTNCWIFGNIFDRIVMNSFSDRLSMCLPSKRYPPDVHREKFAHACNDGHPFDWRLVHIDFALFSHLLSIIMSLYWNWSCNLGERNLERKWFENGEKEDHTCAWLPPVQPSLAAVLPFAWVWCIGIFY